MERVAIIGVGALGSHVVQFLRNEAELKVIDFDRVETKNLQSQFHGRPHVGKLKVESLKRTMDFLYGTKLLVVPHRLTADNLDAVLNGRVGTDLMIDCLDNARSRRLVQAYAEQAAVPCLHGALAADGSFGRVVWTEQFTVDEEAHAGAATCAHGVHLPFIAITAAYLARAAQQYLTDGRRVSYAITPTGTITL